MDKNKSNTIIWWVMGFVFLIDVFIFYNKGKMVLMAFFLICSLLEFGTAIYYTVKGKKNKEVEEE